MGCIHTSCTVIAFVSGSRTKSRSYVRFLVPMEQAQHKIDRDSHTDPTVYAAVVAAGCQTSGRTFGTVQLYRKNTVAIGQFQAICVGN